MLLKAMVADIQSTIYITFMHTFLETNRLRCERTRALLCLIYKCIHIVMGILYTNTNVYLTLPEFFFNFL